MWEWITISRGTIEIKVWNSNELREINSYPQRVIGALKHEGYIPVEEKQSEQTLDHPRSKLEGGLTP